MKQEKNLEINIILNGYIQILKKKMDIKIQQNYQKNIIYIDKIIVDVYIQKEKKFMIKKRNQI